MSLTSYWESLHHITQERGSSNSIIKRHAAIYATVSIHVTIGATRVVKYLRLLFICWVLQTTRAFNENLENLCKCAICSYKSIPEQVIIHHSNFWETVSIVLSSNFPDMYGPFLNSKDRSQTDSIRTSDFCFTLQQEARKIVSPCTNISLELLVSLSPLKGQGMLIKDLEVK